MERLRRVTGHVHSAVVDRHRSREFIAFLRQLDANYPPATKLRLVLDNRAHFQGNANLSGDLPVRIRVHATVHGLVESFFSKVARTLLRGVTSKEELVERRGTNKQPVAFKWTCKDTPAR